MAKYDDLEHDSAEDPATAQLPAGVSSPLPGAEPAGTSNPLTERRRVMKAKAPVDDWMHPDNPALWEGDVGNDD